ncbi:MAG: hypothetical protein ACREYB_11780 [Casimicrobiaceae bacterium]
MDTSTAATIAFARSKEDVGNIVELGHVNLAVPDQALATHFYVSGLGLTRDPYMMPGTDLMWINVGRGQFHLPTRPPMMLRGTIGLVVPDIEALLARFAIVEASLQATKFSYCRNQDAIEATCPWGNRFRLHEPDVNRFGPITLGMPYVEFDVPQGTPLVGIVTFYREILDGIADVEVDAGGEYAWVSVGPGNRFVFRATSATVPPFDGHHVQIALADFSGPHRKLVERGLVTQESDQHQYRFQHIVDPSSGSVLLTLEHEVRSMTHPMYGRALVNRNAEQTNRNYVPGYEAWRWAMPVG